MSPTTPEPAPGAVQLLLQACQALHDCSDEELLLQLGPLAPNPDAQLPVLRQLSQSVALLRQQLQPDISGVGGNCLTIKKIQKRRGCLC